MNWGEITHLLSIYHLLPSSWDVQVVESPGVGGRVTVGKVVERFEFFFFFYEGGGVFWVVGCWCGWAYKKTAFFSMSNELLTINYD